MRKFFVNKHRLRIQNRRQNVQKRVRNVYTSRLSFHFACHRCCWLGTGRSWATTTKATFLLPLMSKTQTAKKKTPQKPRDKATLPPPKFNVCAEENFWDFFYRFFFSRRRGKKILCGLQLSGIFFSFWRMRGSFLQTHSAPQRREGGRGR